MDSIAIYIRRQHSGFLVNLEGGLLSMTASREQKQQGESYQKGDIWFDGKISTNNGSVLLFRRDHPSNTSSRIFDVPTIAGDDVPVEVLNCLSRFGAVVETDIC